ncbi:hypothetical protein AMK31_04055 [Streptomyces sp. TSRI0107]|nr:hypothetical protein AMK31_04055 [Streptomyces sp. TSRI0107]
MVTLADRRWRLLNLTAGRQLALPLGGRYFDIVVTANGVNARGLVTLLDDLQWGPGDATDACGPVIKDLQRGWLIWCVPPGTAAQWASHRYAMSLGAPYELALPPLDQTEPPGPYWLRRLRSDRLVPPGPLRQCLDQFQPGPVPHAAVLGTMLRTIS